MEAQRGDKIESYLPKRMGGLPIAGVAAADSKVVYEPKPDGTGNYRNDVVDLYQLGADGHTITMMANVVLQFCVPRIGPARSEENPRTISIKGDMVPGIDVDPETGEVYTLDDLAFFHAEGIRNRAGMNAITQPTGDTSDTLEISEADLVTE